MTVKMILGAWEVGRERNGCKGIVGLGKYCLPLLFVIMWIVLNQSSILSQALLVIHFVKLNTCCQMVCFPRVTIIINNNTCNEVLSEPLLKIFLVEFGWRSFNNQANGKENKY